MFSRFAEVVVHTPVRPGGAGAPLRPGIASGAPVQAYHYAVPPGMTVAPGQLVWVSFASQYLQGLVLALSDTCPVAEPKPILQVMDPVPYLQPWQLGLARWVADHYLCSLAEAAFAMLPPGVEQRVVTTFEPLLAVNEALPPGLTRPQRDLLLWLQKAGPVGVDEVRRVVKRTVKTDGVEVATQLVRRGLVRRVVRIVPPSARAKTERTARSAANVTSEVLASLRRAPRQKQVLEYLSGAGEQAVAAVVKQTGASSPAAVAALAARGLVTLGERAVDRDPLSGRDYARSHPLPLTEEQAAAWDELEQGLGDTLGEPAGKPRTYLVHGVTGSGKTELYLRAMARAVELGRRVIMMVPEIALTPQTIQRFASRFPGRVTVLHSQLSEGERFDQWRRVRDGLADVVIGSRSTVFAPVPRLGLIVLDEEHEWTYKQTEPAPRYHARETALELARLTGAVVLLGSATPDVESYYRASRGDYHLLELPHRVPHPIFATGHAPTESPALTGDLPAGMPPVEVVDLRAELQAGNRSIFSRSLTEAMTTALAAGQQVILFLNRRGSSTFILCRDCGHVLTCKQCDVPYSYHEVEDDLVCHRCGRRALVPRICPQCWSKRIRFLGTGTQKVEDEVRRVFPAARVLRWDRDVTGGKGAHEEILEKFASHQADVLVGTQMIAKGLDLPLVTLVGVVSADVTLHLPDFRSAERTFQLLTQVSGRTGRSALGGRVIVQTYTPEHHAIQAASRHDYQTFYLEETAQRRQHGLPPYSRLIKMTYGATNEKKAQGEAERVALLLGQRIADMGIAGTDVYQCAACFVARLRGRYRWQVVVRGADPAAALAGVGLPPGWTVDVDPVSLL